MGGLIAELRLLRGLCASLLVFIRVYRAATTAGASVASVCQPWGGSDPVLKVAAGTT